MRELPNPVTISSSTRRTVSACKRAGNFRSAIEKEHRGKYYRGNLGYTIGGVVLSLLVLGALIGFGDVHPDSVVALAVPAVGGVIWGRAAVSAARAFLRRRTLVRRIFAAIGFSVVGFILFCVIGFFVITAIDSIDTGEWPVFAAVGGLALVNVVFFVLMGAPTPLGAKLMAGIEGLKTYLTLAERDRLNMAGAPKMSPQHFETLLPYAVALGVERPWSDTFETWLQAPRPVRRRPPTSPPGITAARSAISAPASAAFLPPWPPPSPPPSRNQNPRPPPASPPAAVFPAAVVAGAAEADGRLSSFAACRATGASVLHGHPALTGLHFTRLGR